MGPQSPCLNCKNRHIGCHSECSLYIEFREALDMFNYKVQQEKELHALEVAYAIEKARRLPRHKK